MAPLATWPSGRAAAHTAPRPSCHGPCLGPQQGGPQSGLSVHLHFVEDISRQLANIECPQASRCAKSRWTYCMVGVATTLASCSNTRGSPIWRTKSIPKPKWASIHVSPHWLPLICPHVVTPHVANRLSSVTTQQTCGDERCVVVHGSLHQDHHGGQVPHAVDNTTPLLVFVPPIHQDAQSSLAGDPLTVLVDHV